MKLFISIFPFLLTAQTVPLDHTHTHTQTNPVLVPVPVPNLDIQSTTRKVPESLLSSTRLLNWKSSITHSRDSKSKNKSSCVQCFKSWEKLSFAPSVPCVVVEYHVITLFVTNVSDTDNIKTLVVVLSVVEMRQGQRTNITNLITKLTQPF